MGRVEQQPDGSWRARWRGADGKKQGDDERFSRKAEARRHANRQEAAARDQGAPSSEMTWSAWKPTWQAERKPLGSARSTNSELTNIRLHIEPYWGQWRLADITRPAVQSWVDQLVADGMSAGTTRKVLAQFSNSMKLAWLHEPPLLHRNPCTGVDKPPLPPRKKATTFTLEQLQSVLDNLDYADQVLSVVNVYLGLRWEELVGLHWSSVNFETDEVLVQDVWMREEKVIRGFPKNRKPHYVTMLPALREALLEWRQRRPPTPARCGHPHVAWRGEGAGTPCTSALVFSPDGGRPLDDSAFRRRLAAACRLAGLEPRTPHDFRRSCATWLIEGGAPLKVVQEVLGHQSITTTELYVRLPDGYQREVMLRAHKNLQKQAKKRRRGQTMILPGSRTRKNAPDSAPSPVLEIVPNDH